MEHTTTTYRLAARGAAAALALLCGALAPALAQAQGVFLCVDANGRKELTDSYRRGCKTLDLPSNIVAPPTQRGLPKLPRPPAAPATAPADFPKVNSAEQRARDADRRAILSDELRAEHARLAELRAEYKGGEPDRLGNERNYAKYQARVAELAASIARSEANIQALNRELNNIK